MSRRTKLLITVLFLVLLGVFGFLLAMSWGARDPLQFRVERLGYEGDDLIAHMNATNTSDIPVYLYVGVWRKPVIGKAQMEIVGYLIPRNQRSGPSSRGWLYLAPGAIISCTVPVSEYFEYNSALFHQAQMDYHWRSGLAEQVSESWAKLTREAPKPIQKLLPEDIGIFVHHAPLGPPPKDEPSTTTQEPVPVSR
jgi:hypothetical protein